MGNRPAKQRSPARQRECGANACSGSNCYELKIPAHVFLYERLKGHSSFVHPEAASESSRDNLDKVFLQSGLALEVDQLARLDITLPIGDATVISEVPLVRTQDTTTGRGAG